jgi:Tfp pilus assembly protein PilV
MKRGLSLIEVVLAIALFMVILMGMLGIFDQGYVYLFKTKFRIPAYNLARAVVEEYYDWVLLDALDGTTNGTLVNGTYDYPGSPVTLNLFSSNCAFNISLNISNSTLNSTDLKQVRVTVDWPAGNFSLTTLKANF